MHIYKHMYLSIYICTLHIFIITAHLDYHFSSYRIGVWGESPQSLLTTLRSAEGEVSEHTDTFGETETRCASSAAVANSVQEPRAVVDKNNLSKTDLILWQPPTCQDGHSQSYLCSWHGSPSPPKFLPPLKGRRPFKCCPLSPGQRWYIIFSSVLHYRQWNISLYYFPHQEHTSAGILGKKWGCLPLTKIINNSGPLQLSASPAATRKHHGLRPQFHSVSCGYWCPLIQRSDWFSKIISPSWVRTWQGLKWQN